MHAHPDGQRFRERMLRLAGGSEREGGTRPRFGVIAEDHQPWVSLIGSHSGEIPVKPWEGLDSRYHFENTDVNIDGFAVAVDGPAAELGALDCPRDFGDQSRDRADFLTAELRRSGVPFFMRAYKGNTPGPEQYGNVLPDIFPIIREGLWIIVDNGGASGDMPNSIAEAGHRYLARVRTDVSDGLRTTGHGTERQYAEDGVCCPRHTFDHSEGTTYLFLSRDDRLRPHGRSRPQLRGREVQEIGFRYHREERPRGRRSEGISADQVRVR